MGSGSSTWIYKIAANTAIDYLRKKRIPVLPLDHADGKDSNIPDYSNHPERNLSRKEGQSGIMAAIDSLLDKYREVMTCLYEGYGTYEDIADLLDIPLGTVKVRISKARELLRERIRVI